VSRPQRTPTTDLLTHCWLFQLHGAAKAQRAARDLGAGLAFNLLVVGYTVATGSLQFLGFLGCSASVLMFAAPLSTMAAVVRDKDSISMPWQITAGSFLCSACWSTYGLSIGDLWVWLPNVAGFALAAAQAALISKYPPGRQMYGGVSRNDTDDIQMDGLGGLGGPARTLSSVSTYGRNTTEV